MHVRFDFSSLATSCKSVDMRTGNFRSEIVSALLALLVLSLVGCACGSENRTADGSVDSSQSDSSLLLCQPSSSRCSAEDVPQLCNAEGSAWVDQDACLPPQRCSQGACVDPCQEAEEERGYIGCTFWPTSLPNLRRTIGGRDSPLIVALSNPNDFEVTATITGGALDNPVITKVAAASTEAIELPPVEELAMGNQTGNISRIVPGGGYLVRTNFPVAAYQFPTAGTNPDDVPNANDASLLLPAGGLGQRYTLLAYDDMIYAELQRNPACATIVAVEEGETTVSIKAAGGFQTADTGPTIPKMVRGSEETIVLNQGDVLRLMGDVSGGNDITGTRFETSQSVALFSAHHGARIPYDSDLLLDHFQEQQPADESWGKKVVVSPLADGPTSVIRILAQSANTQLTFSPETFYPTQTLGDTEFVEIALTEAVMIEASEPILVGQYIESSNGAAQSPSLTFVAPTEQYRTSYSLYVPLSHPNESHLQIIGPANAAPVVDEVPVSEQPVAIEATDYVAWTVQVGAGRHTVTASMPVGIETFGVENATTYIYPGGADYERINLR